MMLFWRIAFAASALLWAQVSIAQGDDWPSKPVRILVGFGPGGGTDVVSRILADRLPEVLGQQFVVENRTGASGTIAGGTVAKAPNDGYTALVISTGHSASAALVKELPYDPVSSFAPVGILAYSAYVVAVPKESPATDLQSLVQHINKEPDKLNYSTVGPRSTPHLVAEHLIQRTGMKVRQFPVRNTGEVVTALLRGDAAFGVELFHAIRGQVDSGDLRLIAVSTSERWPAAPSVPTLAESGLPGFAYTAWYGWLFPAGTPPTIIDKMHKALQQVMAIEDVKKKFENAGAVARLSAPAELDKLIASDIISFREVAQKSGIEAK